MEYRRLGRSGLHVSALSLGSWMNFGDRISDADAAATMHAAYAAGVNFFDNAEAYAEGKSEMVMGNILKQSGWERSSYVISSKVFWGGKLPNQTGLSRKHIVEACHAALERLQVDYLDLFFCHRADLDTPVEETVSAMSDLIRQGKILYWGTSEWPVARIMQAFEVAATHHLYPPVMEQPQYSMLVRDRFEREYQQLFELKGYGATIWSPLASGLLTDKFLAPSPDENATRLSDPKNEWLKKSLAYQAYEKNPSGVKKLTELAAELDMPLAALALAWCLKQPNVSSVITGASSCSQLQQNLAAIDYQTQLTADVLDRIETLLQNKPDTSDWKH